MATGLVVARLLKHLRYLLNDDVVVRGGLQERVTKTMDVLKSIPRSIRDAENHLISSNAIDDSLPKLREFLKNNRFERETMAIGSVVEPLLKQLGSLLNNHDVVVRGGLQDQLKKVMDVLESIPKSIRDAKNQSIDDLISSNAIGDSLPKLREFLKKLESLGEFLKKLELLGDIIHTLISKKDQQVQQKGFIKNMCVCPHIPLLSRQSDDQIRLSTQMDEFLKYAKALADGKEDGQTPGDEDKHHQLQKTQSENYDSYIVGFEKEEEELTKKLISSDYNWMGFIALTGKDVSGKTALTKKVYNKAEIKKHFQARAWVNPFKDFSNTEVLGDILTQLSGEREVKNVTEEELRERIEKFLEEKSSLLVIDDISFDERWFEFVLNFILSMQSARSRIVFTTKKYEEFLPPYLIIQLRSLTDKESWTLFMKKANITEDSTNNPVLVELKEKILKKCGGLPPAIELLGRLLSTRELTQWSSVIEQPKSKEDFFVLSYQDLPYQIKSCFLYFGLFPRAFDVPVRRLFHLWVAEGLVTVPDGEKNKVPEDLAEEPFKELVRRNMIKVSSFRSNGSPKKCRVPEGRFYDIYKKAFELIASFNKYSSIGKYDPQEKGMLPKNVNIDGAFSRLMVLDLEGASKPELPESLEKILLHLMYLGLRRTFLNTLSESIGDLPYLETLDIKHTRITKLKGSIWNAKNLRHLYLNNIHFPIPCENTKSTGSLTKLQTLWGLFIGTDKSLVENCLNKLTLLRKLGLTFHLKSVEAVSEWVSQLKILQSLRLRSCDEFGRPSGLDQLGTLKQHDKLTDLYLLGKLSGELIKVDQLQLPPNLKILTLSASQLEEDPMPVLGKLRNLNILRLYSYSYLGTTMSCPSGGFPELRVLKLWRLKKLEEWIVEEGAMPRLRELEIRRCNKLLVVNGLQKVTTLEDIILMKMPKELVADATRFMEVNVSIIKVNERKFSPFRVKWRPTSSHEDPEEEEE